MLVACCALAWSEPVASEAAPSVLTISGVVTAPSGARLPQPAFVTVTLSEQSLGDDAPRQIIGRAEVRSPLRFPVPFAFEVDASKIDRTATYVLLAEVLTRRTGSAASVVVFSSEEGTPVRPGRDTGAYTVKVFPWSAYVRWYDTAHPPD